MARKSKKEVHIESKLGRRSSAESGPSASDLARIALDLFAKRHFSSVTIKDISRAAGISTAMIYYYYKSKEQLFRVAIDNAVDEAFQLFEKHGDSENYAHSADAIGAWFDVHLVLKKRLRNVVKISVDLNGVLGSLPEADESIQRFYNHEREILEKFVREGIEKGVFREVDPSIIATMISTSLDGVMARSFILKNFDMHATVEEFKQAIWLYLGYDGRSRIRQARTGVKQGKMHKE